MVIWAQVDNPTSSLNQGEEFSLSHEILSSNLQPTIYQQPHSNSLSFLAAWVFMSSTMVDFQQRYLTYFGVMASLQHLKFKNLIDMLQLCNIKDKKNGSGQQISQQRYGLHNLLEAVNFLQQWHKRVNCIMNEVNL